MGQASGKMLHKFLVGYAAEGAEEDPQLKQYMDKIPPTELHKVLLSEDGIKALHKAVTSHHVETRNVILAHALMFDSQSFVQDVSGKTVLSLAAWHGYTDTVKAIFGTVTSETKRDLLATFDVAGDSAVSLAAGERHIETVLYIVDHVDTVTRAEILDCVESNVLYNMLYRNQLAFHEAITKGHVSALRSILDSLTSDHKYSLLMLKYSVKIDAPISQSWPEWFRSLWENEESSDMSPDNSADSIKLILGSITKESVALAKDQQCSCTCTCSSDDFDHNVIEELLQACQGEASLNIQKTLTLRDAHRLLLNTDGVRSLYTSACDGQIERLKLILIDHSTCSQSFNIAILNSIIGKTVFSLAACNGHCKTVVSLLDYIGQDARKAILDNVPSVIWFQMLFKRNPGEENGFLEASHVGFTDAMKDMLTRLTLGQRKELFSTVDRDQNTAFALATRNGNDETIHFLSSSKHLSLYEQFSMKNKEGDTPLHLAACNGFTHSLKTLLESLSPKKMKKLVRTKNDKGDTALSVAAFNGYAISVQFLIDHIPEYERYCQLSINNEMGKTAIHRAAANGHNETINTILDALSTTEKYNILQLKDHAGDTAVSEAAYNGHPESIKHLLQRVDQAKRYDILCAQNDQHSTAVHIAAYEGHTETLMGILSLITSSQRNELLARSIDREYTVLACAAYFNHTEAVRCILDSMDAIARYDVLKERNNDGMTVLHGVASRGYSDVITSILDSVDATQICNLISLKENKGYTPLSIAAHHGHQETVRNLLKKLDVFAKFNILIETNAYDQNTLHVATNKGHFQTISLILDALSHEQNYQLLKNLDAINKESAFSCAARKGEVEIIRCMMKSIESKHIFSLLKSQNGCTALQHMVSGNHQKDINDILQMVPAEQRKAICVCMGWDVAVGHQILLVDGDADSDEENFPQLSLTGSNSSCRPDEKVRNVDDEGLFLKPKSPVYKAHIGYGKDAKPTSEKTLDRLKWDTDKLKEEQEFSTRKMKQDICTMANSGTTFLDADFEEQKVDGNAEKVDDQLTLSPALKSYTKNIPIPEEETYQYEIGNITDERFCCDLNQSDGGVVADEENNLTRVSTNQHSVLRRPAVQREHEIQIMGHSEKDHMAVAVAEEIPASNMENSGSFDNNLDDQIKVPMRKDVGD